MGQWHATLDFYTMEEGFLPSAKCWDSDSKKWRDYLYDPVAFRSRKTFDTEAEAQAWASAHDSPIDLALWVEHEDEPLG